MDGLKRSNFPSSWGTLSPIFLVTSGSMDWKKKKKKKAAPFSVHTNHSAFGSLFVLGP
jgi:hypothetical protein